MVRGPCCSEEGLNKGAWSATEDKILSDYIRINGDGKWRNLPKMAGLKRCGKSCRLRWLNYLRPDIKRGNITDAEEDLIIRLHKLLGNRWSLIAGRLPGRTDNELKNYWNTIIIKKIQGASPANSDPKEYYKSKQKQNSSTSCLVHPKASRCTKVHIAQDQENTHQLDITPVLVPVGQNMDQVTNAAVTHGGDSQYDFEMDDKFLSDFFNTTEYAPLFTV